MIFTLVVCIRLRACCKGDSPTPLKRETPQVAVYSFVLSSRSCDVCYSDIPSKCNINFKFLCNVCFLKAIVQGLPRNTDSYLVNSGRAAAQAQSLASRRGGPFSSLGQIMWNLWWTKRHYRMFSPSASVSFSNHSTDCSTLIIYHWSWYSRPNSGRRTN
jgi:hypothetical protein